jgi:Domain of unknown function (DUF4407)
MLKYDASNQAHVETPEPKVGLIRRSLVTAGGAQADLALKYCSPKEIADFMLLGVVLLISAALSSVTAATIFHLAFGDGGFDLILMLAGLGVGGLQGVVDCAVQYRATIQTRGLLENRIAGLKLPAPENAIAALRKIRLLRGAQGVTVGLLGGVVFLLAAMNADIRSYIDAKDMIDNRVAAYEMSRMVDAGIGRSKEALALQTAELANLSRAAQTLRTNDVRRATSRKLNQPSAASPNSQLVALEKRLAEETAKRDDLKSALEKQEAGRNAAIESAVSRAPGHTPKRTGLSAQLAALVGLVHETPLLLLFVIGFMIVSLALELGPMICSATHIPSIYAARVTLDHYLEVTKLASDGAQKLGARAAESIAGSTADPQGQSAVVASDLPKAANDNAGDTSALNGARPRRPVGRPRGSSRKNGGAEPTV